MHKQVAKVVVFVSRCVYRSSKASSHLLTKATPLRNLFHKLLLSKFVSFHASAQNLVALIITGNLSRTRCVVKLACGSQFHILCVKLALSTWKIDIKVCHCHVTSIIFYEFCEALQIKVSKFYQFFESAQASCRI